MSFCRLHRISFRHATAPLTHSRFQWVVLQIRQLHSLSRPRDVETRIGKLPKTLEEAYHEIYDRIQAEEGSASEVANRAFRWIMCSEEPISPAMLVFVVCQDPTTDKVDVVDIDIDFVLESCQNLLKVEPGRFDQVCRFSHLSVQEYLENTHWNQIQTNVLMAQVCLIILNDPLQQVFSHSVRLALKKTLRSKKIDGSETPSESGDLNEPEESSKESEDLNDSEDLSEFESLGEFEMPNEFEDLDEYVDRKLTRTFLALSQEVQKGMMDANRYAQRYCLIHVQRTGEIKGDFDHRLITLLKRFLGSPTETALAYRNWLRAQTSRSDRLDLPSIHTQRTEYFTSEELTPIYLPSLPIAMFGLHRMLEDWWDDVDPGQENEWGHPLLVIAAKGGCASTVESLLEKGADVDVTGSGVSALYIASLMGNEPLVKGLLRNGANVNLRGGPHNTALQMASLCGYEPIVRLLLARGADVNAQREDCGNALRAASGGGHEPVVRLLLAEGADVNAQWGEHSTALQAALRNGRDGIVKILLKHGALDRDGEALKGAAQGGNELLVAMLLQGSTICLNDVLLAACRGDKKYPGKTQSKVENVVRLLLGVGALDPHGEALIEAAREGYKPAVTQLLKVNNFGIDKALVAACKPYSTRYGAKTKEDVKMMVELLLDAGAVDPEGEALCEGC